jgi:murein L,D-transpeptidase YafK
MDGPRPRLKAAGAALVVALVLVLARPAGAALEIADRVVVHKAERKLHLMREGRVLRTFNVALGLSPKGHKRMEGDFRTPEGSYRLDGRKPDSEFFLAIQISYPNADDRRRAASEGVAPGGLIMIHGQPNRPKRPLEYYRTSDWTNGCIAVSNADMVDIWLMTPENTPIDIVP